MKHKQNKIESRAKKISLVLGIILVILFTGVALYLAYQNSYINSRASSFSEWVTFLGNYRRVGKSRAVVLDRECKDFQVDLVDYEYVTAPFNNEDVIIVDIVYVNKSICTGRFDYILSLVDENNKKYPVDSSYFVNQHSNTEILKKGDSEMASFPFRVGGRKESLTLHGVRAQDSSKNFTIELY